MPGLLRILIAEDDRDLLELTRAMLAPSGEVDVADHPAPALRLIAGREYQLLITDLNICHPCDGLLLAAAMRTLHPGSRTVLLTGNPDFTRALQFMQSTLDLIILKPVEPAVLRNLSRMDAVAPPPTTAHHPPGKATIADVLASHRAEILASWLKMVAADRVLGPLPLGTSERLDHITHVLDGLAGQHAPGDAERQAAEAHGYSRHAQNYRAEWVAKELSYLRRAGMEVVLKSLLDLDLSQLPESVLNFHTRLDADLLYSLQAFGLVNR